MSAALKPDPGPAPIPGRITVAEFLQWAADDPSGQKWELVDGTPVAMAPAWQTHGLIQMETGRLIGNHLVSINSPCRIGVETGIIPRVNAATNYRIPDLGVTCGPPNDSYALPDPVLLIEIVSMSNETKTRANVWSYTTIPSVVEILLVSSITVKAELLRRQPDGAWPQQAATLGPDSTLELVSIGFKVPLRALYRTTALASADPL